MREQRPGYWILRADLPRDPRTHKRRTVVRGMRGSKTEAKRALSKLETDVAEAKIPLSEGTLAHLCNHWLELATPDLAPSTVANYRGVLRRHVLPELGALRIRNIGPADLDGLYARLRNEGVGLPTIDRAHRVLHRAFSEAVRWGWMPTNPAARARPPRQDSPATTTPDPSAVMKLLAAAVDHDAELAVFLRLAAVTGCRRGELCGLRWSDLNLEDRSLGIARAIADDVAGRGTLVKGPKTRRSIRRVSLDPTTVAILVAHRARCEKQAAKAQCAYGDDSYVFSPEPAGVRHWHPDTVSDRFAVLRDKVGLTGVRLHDLRHFVGTYLTDAGLSVTAVSGRLGHSRASTTLDIYSSVVDARDRQAADVLGQLLAGPNRKET